MKEIFCHSDMSSKLLFVGGVGVAGSDTTTLGVKEDTIKNTTERDNVIKYLSRNQDCIPCYALRKKLGLRVCRNPVEKANDLVVSNRQKHHGMSWSADGSTSLATLTSVRRNDEHMHWLRHRDIRFTFPQPAAKPAA
jgi:hypothetical protein